MGRIGSASTVVDGRPARRSVRPWLKLAALVAVLAGLYLAARASGLLERMDLASLRATVQAAGALGIVIFVLLFAAGTLLQVPGMVFIATGILVYGKFVGYFASLGGAIAAVCVTFLLARAVGGEALAAVERPWVKRILDKLQRRPVRYLVLLRLVLFISPPVNYALALTPLRFRDYAIGSALGLVAPVAFVTLAFDWLFSTPWIRSYLF